jgi:hypothetical protein
MKKTRAGVCNGHGTGLALVRRQAVNGGGSAIGSVIGCEQGWASCVPACNWN